MTTWFIFSSSWVVKIEDIGCTCSVCQGTSGNYSVLSWSTFTGREVIEHLEMVSDRRILLLHCIDVLFKCCRYCDLKHDWGVIYFLITQFTWRLMNGILLCP